MKWCSHRLFGLIVGLLIIWSSNFTITLGFLVDTFGEAEAAITAIERVDAMSTLPQEKGMATADEVSPPDSWPSSGRLDFEQVCLRYRDGLPLALNDLSFTIQPGQSCGVVGRTGAGTSRDLMRCVSETSISSTLHDFHFQEKVLSLWLCSDSSRLNLVASCWTTLI